MTIIEVVRIVLMTFARDECQIWPEWLEHHRRQGIAHFYIIDNNSTVGCGASSALGADVTVWPWSLRPGRHALSTSTQEFAYNHYLPLVRAAEEGMLRESSTRESMVAPSVATNGSTLEWTNKTWLALWDADEFVFGTSQPLAQVLATLPHTAHQMCLNWLTFGSSGLDKQPKCVTASNIFRHPLPAEAIGKCMQRLDEVNWATIHRSVLKGESGTPIKRRRFGCVCAPRNVGKHAVLPCHRAGAGMYTTAACDAPHNESELATHTVRLHHYSLQSHEAMVRRQLRGGGATAGRKHDQLFWARLEWGVNLQRDVTLRDHARRARCTPGPEEAAPRVLARAGDHKSTRFNWDTWSSLPWTVRRETFNVRPPNASLLNHSSKSELLAAVSRTANAESNGDATTQPNTATLELEFGSISSPAATGYDQTGEMPQVSHERKVMLSKWTVWMCQLTKMGRLTHHPDAFVPDDQCCGCLLNATRYPHLFPPRGTPTYSPVATLRRKRHG